MINVQKLQNYNAGCLGAIRQRLGAEDENDTSFDVQINAMTSEELTFSWAAWFLGNNSWGKDIINLYKHLTKIDAHICQGGKVKGVIRKYPALLCSLCMTKKATDLTMSEEDINTYNSRNKKISDI